MTFHSHKFLNTLLILLMMFAPLRSVMALQMQQCHSNALTSSQTSTSVDSVIADADDTDADVHKYHQSMSGSMPMQMSMPMSHSADAGDIKNTHDCCCDCSKNCASGCDSGMVVSLGIQQTLFSPVYINASETGIIVSSLIVRELTPPSRPPELVL